MSPSVAVPPSVGPTLTASGPSRLPQLPSEFLRPLEALIQSHSSNTSGCTWPTCVNINYNKRSKTERNLLRELIQYGDVKSLPPPLSS